MRSLMRLTVPVVLLIAISGVAADRRAPEQQIELLQKRIASLEKELAMLKSAIELRHKKIKLLCPYCSHQFLDEESLKIVE